jgi:hypothetical protein
MPRFFALTLFWVCVAACVGAQGALFLTEVRRQERAARRIVRELVWAAVPAIGLALLLGASWGFLS